MTITAEYKAKLDQNFSLNADQERPVKDFPFYSTRLTTIDYNKIIADG